MPVDKSNLGWEYDRQCYGWYTYHLLLDDISRLQELRGYLILTILQISWTSTQSYIPSCSQMSTRKSTISVSGIGWGNGLLLPSKLSYVAFQFNLGSWGSCSSFPDLLFPTQQCLVWFQRRRPWFTNSETLLILPEPPCWSRVWFWFAMLIDEMLPCDCTAL